MNIFESLQFGGLRRIFGLPDAVADDEPVSFGQLKAREAGMSWKDNARVAAQVNVNLAAPGATIDGITLAVNDRVVVPLQTAQPENGIYIWNGAAVPMTRALDANTAAGLENASVIVDEGTSAGVTYRQQTVNFVLGTGNVVFGAATSTAPPASETTAGIAELATQAEVDAGTDALRIVTIARLLASPFARKLPVVQNVGDGSALTYTITHNFGTRDVSVDFYRNSGNYDDALVGIRRTTVNTIDVVFEGTAPALNAWRVVIRN